MNTAKPISTISWNSEPFLREKLTELLKARKIDFWAFIHHDPEDDEAGGKPHFHVYIEPSKRTQTAVLKDEFKEYDPTHPDKPLGVLAFRNSKFSDWYLYALHDSIYLAAKMQSRRHHYAPDHVQSADSDELRARVYSVDMSDLTPQKRLQAFKEAGKTFGEAVQTGIVPIAQIHQYEVAWNYLAEDRTDRNGRPGHPDFPPIDPATGELLASPDSCPPSSGDPIDR